MHKALRTLLALGLLTAPASSSLLLAEPLTKDIRAQLSTHMVGENLRLTLTDGSHLEGRIVAIRPDSLEIAPKHTQQHRELSYAQIRNLHPHNSIGSRLQMGPCVGPEVYLIGGPIVVVKDLFGH